MKTTHAWIVLCGGLTTLAITSSGACGGGKASTTATGGASSSSTTTTTHASSGGGTDGTGGSDGGPDGTGGGFGGFGGTGGTGGTSGTGGTGGAGGSVTTASSPACDPPTTSPSMGACFTPPSGGCNPVTNTGCPAGSTCDTAATGFTCYSAPPATVATCGACDDVTTACVPGDSCYQTLCAKYCCDDGDCGSGMCDKTLTTDPNVGLCIVKQGGSDAGSDAGHADGGDAGDGG